MPVYGFLGAGGVGATDVDGAAEVEETGADSEGVPLLLPPPLQAELARTHTVPTTANAARYDLVEMIMNCPTLGCPLY
jgi:hypothetical protein